MKHRLRFSKWGAPEVERSYRTHYVSPTLSEAKRKRREATLATFAGNGLQPDVNIDSWASVLDRMEEIDPTG